MKYLLFLLLSSNLSGTIKESDLVGFWQDAPNVGSGYSNHYQFFADGKFIFNYNQMDCEKRVVSYSGTWTMGKKGMVLLTVDQKVMVEGGRLAPSEGSCGSEYEIQGGQERTVVLRKTEIHHIQLSDHVKKDKETDVEIPCIKINGVKYWRLSTNPENK